LKCAIIFVVRKQVLCHYFNELYFFVVYKDDFYKDQSLFEVLSAIGLSETDLQTEALRFYPKVMDAFNEHGILEPLLQALLAPFYQSSKTLDIIEKHFSE